MEHKPSGQTWVLFAAIESDAVLQRAVHGLPAPPTRYRVENVVEVSGAGPTGVRRGANVIRIESDRPISIPSDFAATVGHPVPMFRGVTQHLHYTGQSERQDLEAHSRAPFTGSSTTSAVLIPIGKSQAWWHLAQDHRHAHFHSANDRPGHTAIGRPYVDRVFRKLYHSRYQEPPTPYDFLTYFEFKSDHTEDFKTLLGELRNIERNPEWTHVELEYEIWLTKLG